MSLSKLNNQQPLAGALLLTLPACANSNYGRAFNCSHTDVEERRAVPPSTASVFLDGARSSSSTSARRSRLAHPPSQRCLSSSLSFSLDGGGGPREDGSVQFPVGAGRGGAAGQPAGGLSVVLFHQTGALAGEPPSPLTQARPTSALCVFMMAAG